MTDGSHAPGSHRRLATPEIRFLVAGALAAAVNWLARFPLELIMPFALAVLGALAVGMTCGFLLYDRWVFPGSARPIAAKIRGFIAVNVATQVVMFVLSVALREAALRAGIAPLPAGAGAHMLGIGAGAIVSYLGHRSLTFGARH